MARKGRKPAPPKPRVPRTEWQRKRDDALAAAGFTKKDVWQQLRSAGGSSSVQTVRSALDGRFRNEAVIAAFCALTKMDPLDAFPLDEPAYGRDPKPRRMTSARRAALRSALGELKDAILQSSGERTG